MRLWGGRFGEDGPDARMADFTRSIEVDAELALDDIAGSIAHVRGLGRAGLLTEDEVRTLERGLVVAARGRRGGPVAWDPALEDVHLNLETMLTERVGAVGGKLHTGRSRNDQVATDLRLWTRRAIGRLDAALVGLERALVGLAEPRRRRRAARRDPHPARAARAVRPPPARLRRDARARPRPARRRAGAAQRLAAGAGRARRRGLPARPRGDGRGARVRRRHAPTRSTPSRTATSWSRCWRRRRSRWSTSRGSPRRSTWWSNPRFGWVRVADAFSTGSSMMPNKKNPDPAELVRGRTAGVIGGLTGVAHAAQGPAARVPARPPGGQAGAVRGGRPRSTPRSASWPGSIETLVVDRVRMREAAEEGYTTATALADALVRRGVPFRAAHHIVGGLVGGAEAEGIATLAALPDEAFRAALDGSDDPVARGARRGEGDRGARCARRRRSRARSRRRTSSAGRRRRGSPPPSSREGPPRRLSLRPAPGASVDRQPGRIGRSHR